MRPVHTHLTGLYYRQADRQVDKQKGRQSEKLFTPQICASQHQS